jgi:hypothetical protein
VTLATVYATGSRAGVRLSCSQADDGHVAVASGSSKRPRIPKNAPGLPSLGGSSPDPGMGPAVSLGLF